MKNLLDAIKPTLLMGPGPSCVPEAVYKALAKPTIGHLDPYFVTIMDAIKDSLRIVFNTKNEITMPMSGTGSAGMETCFVNLVEENDKVLILENGVFGTRMADVAGRLGADTEVLSFPWGTVVCLEEIAALLNKQKYDLVALVHAETSTGVCNPVQEIGELVSKNGALFLLDCVTSLGGMEVKLDEWKVDAAYSATQKCLSCPPGLSPVSFSERAISKLLGRKKKVPNWYLDLSLIINYWSGHTRTYHHTAPINMEYALYEALNLILNEGLDKVYARHKAMHEELVFGLGKLGIEMLVAPECRLPMLNSVHIPELKNLTEAEVRLKLLKEDNIEIGAGLGPLAGKIWRIGLMGHTAAEENINKLLKALEKYIV